MTEYRDQMNRIIRLESSPCRIISLVPSQTQLLHHIGLEREVVGITKFCIQPEEWFKSKTRIGGTKAVDIEKVRAMKPDLIIGNKEENSAGDIEQLSLIAPVWMSDISTLDDALEMIHSLGKIVNKPTSDLIAAIQNAFSELSISKERKAIEGKSVLYFIWKEPDMLAGKDTFIDDLLTRIGLLNATNVARYPLLPTDVKADHIFLSSEPYPFVEKHLSLFQDAFPNAKITLVDGEMFSWYGSKLVDAPAYFIKLLKAIG
ncbi:MAG: ABC-type Fe3+-hydroxamate transport system substrate-binding protein [Flavobacteriaceae bacterium]|jgi:ABC-type Fe3+-hydroxamate transport system substrate-binding protein